MTGYRARGALLVLGVVLLGGCGSSPKVTDATSPAAKACRAAIAARITAAFADSQPGTADGNLAMQKALSGKKPNECDRIDDALGAQMIAELGAEHDQMMAYRAAGSSPMPMTH